MGYIFTSESVSEGHPDKVADQISDAILDNFLAYDKKARVACETMVTTGQVFLCGEVTSSHYVDLQDIARKTIKKIGYNNAEYGFDAESCGILSAIHEQSPDIKMGLSQINENEQGAGDQGIMFGYAVNENNRYIPTTLYLSHLILEKLAEIRKNGEVMKYLRPDAKAQVSIRYDDNHVPMWIETIVISTQHDEFDIDLKMREKITNDIKEYLIPMVIDSAEESVKNLFKYNNYELLVNPTGKFVIGGPAGDTGLTGRKIIVDTYGGKGAHGGGCFSGKDPSKVDRSASYMARYIAKNMVAAGVADEMLIQISYAIGKAEPVSVYVNTYDTDYTGLGDDEIAERIKNMFDLRPKAIEKYLKLSQPMYEETASYGHFGRESKIVEKIFKSKYYPQVSMKVELFTWEKLDLINIIKNRLFYNI